ncbi:DUF6494 family protein [Halomonas faecis]|uniref:DUF6494 family protein n=1 Tax=Halomonas faecis TaxID=1562110 RepID=UPI001969E560|nr:DUF6494 family protein [Halomonas faecis]
MKDSASPLLRPSIRMLCFDIDRQPATRLEERPMNDDAFHQSIRKLLKNVGVNSQQAIEQAVREALADGRLRGDESLPASVRVQVAGIDVDLTFSDDITLE